MFSNSLSISALSAQSIVSQSQPITSSHSKSLLPAPSSHNPEWNKFSGLPAAVTTIPKSISTTTSSSIFPTSAITSNSTLDTSSQPYPLPISTNRSSKRPLPVPSSHIPIKKSEWNKFSGLPAVSTIPKSLSTATPSSLPTTSAIISNSTVTSEPPPTKKSTPIWKQTIPDHPAPAWGYAVGMASKPCPKPKAKAPTSGSASFTQSGLPKRYAYRQQHQANNGHARLPAMYSKNQDEDDEDEEEEEETYSDEEDEEQLDFRYKPQNKRQKPTRPSVPIQVLSRVYDQNIKEEMIFTSKRKLRLKRKVTAYKDFNTTNGSVSQAGPAARKRHSYRHAQSVWQQPRFGGRRIHGRQVRPAGGFVCGGCDGSIIGRIVSAMGSRWHPACFRCTVCDELLEHVSSYEHGGRAYCHLDYHEVRSFLPSR
jgi:hypothetical protein